MKILLWKSESSRSYRVIRGGSWYNDSRSLRAGYRIGVVPGFRGEYIGFRCVRPLLDHLIENNKTEESK